MIMIITHDPQRRELLHTYFVQKGYQVRVPPHRQDALAMAKDTMPQVIILDLYVSEPSGVEILRQLREQGYRGKVVALTSPSGHDQLSRAYQLGVDQIVGPCQAVDGQLSAEQVECAVREALRPLIAARAKELWIEHGRPAGQDMAFWLQAERELLRSGPPDTAT